MPHKSLIKSRFSSGGNFTRGKPTISHKIWLENYSSEILFKYPRDQLDNNTVILFQYGRFPECMIIMYWRRLWALWQVECIYVYFLGHCSILPVFSCDQAALWMVQSVRPSVRPSVCPSVRLSVCHTFLTMFPSSYHHEIFRSYYQWQKWRPCKRSRSEVKGQGHRGHNPT